MAITKQNIITFVNDALQESFSGTDLDVAIQMCLDDMSKEDLLEASATPTALVSGGETIDHPTGYRSLISLTLTLTDSGSEQFPLIALKGGHQEYRQLRHNDDSTGIPRWFSSFNGKFYLWRPTNQAASVLVEYYKDHPQNVDSIEFDETIHKNTVYSGCTYYTALTKKKMSYIQLWRPIYEDAKNKDTMDVTLQPRFVRGN